MDEVNVAVSIANIRVRPGNIIFGDADGIVVVPKEYEEEVLKRAQEIEAAEDKIRAAVESGMRLVDARTKFCYHELQHKENQGEK